MLHLRKLPLALLLFVSWIMVSSVLLFYLGNRHYGTFAAELPWQTGSVSLQDLAISATEPLQLVHVFDEHCVCNTRARAHIRKLNINQTFAGTAQHFLSPAKLLAAMPAAMPTAKPIAILVCSDIPRLASMAQVSGWLR